MDILLIDMLGLKRLILRPNKRDLQNGQVLKFGWPEQIHEKIQLVQKTGPGQPEILVT